MQRLSYKGGCGVREGMRIEAIKRRAGLGIDKRLWLIINTLLFKTVSYTTKKLKNKAIVNL